jgi:hypothetical protein
MHGSLLLASSAAAPEVLGLREILESDFHAEPLRQALCRAIAAALDFELQTIQLSSDLRLRAIALADSKYRTAAWNERARAVQPKQLNESVRPDRATPRAAPISQVDC